MSELATYTGDKTPIEILLQIENDEKVSARKLYKFFGLTHRSFARWAASNITENGFAVEGEDYIIVMVDGRGFDIDVEGVSMYAEGNIFPDYRLSVPFAKKLCMLSKTERGEAARNYFIKVEEALKHAVTRVDNFAVLDHMVNMLKSQNEELITVKAEVSDINTRVTAIEQLSKDSVIVANIPQKRYYEALSLYTSTAIGAAFDVSAVTLNKILHEAGVIHPQGKAWLVAKKYKDMEYSKQVTRIVQTSNGKKPQSVTMAWTLQGMLFICELLAQKGYQQLHQVDIRTRSRRPYKKRGVRQQQ